MTGPDFIAKLKLYKTAYSPLFEQYVAINGFHLDAVGDPIIHASLDGDEIMFRAYELERYIL